MSTENLSKKQLAAAQLLAVEGIEKQDIADQLQISRTTLWNWENKNEMFKAEVDRIKSEFRNFGLTLIESKLHKAIEGYWKLVEESNNDMARKAGYEYFIDKVLGKTSTNVKLTTEIENKKVIDEDILEAEFEEWDTNVEEGK